MSDTKTRRTTRLKVSDCPLDLQQYARKFLERLDSGRFDITAMNLSHLSDRNLQRLLGYVPENPKSVDISKHLNLAEVDRMSEKVIIASSTSEIVRNDNLTADLYATGNMDVRGKGRQDGSVAMSNKDVTNLLRERRVKPSGYPKPVPGFQCTVSPAGTVRSTISGRVLKQNLVNGHAYVLVKSDNGAEVKARVARLIVIAAGIECYCKTVVHIDDDFTNYSLDNLRVMKTSDANRERGSMKRALAYKDTLANHRTVCPAKTAMMGYHAD